ncbi:ribosome maturation protein RimP [Sphingomonas oligophenolica]|uniref:Ribosome maturation factor RimP n=1 Tax=Sphingomonas oligophenolica TaxID=301154 RepID=A0A502CMD4_9SPHN|nr:ribosome maturation protein RimP [Sphingomonas oligophenolica]TPG13710.1 ribosome maturation protein RimP [Sphingomonas oligophenolica]
MADIAALTQLIEPEARSLGFDLVRVKMIGGKSDPTLQVMAERPDTRQLTIDDCAELSRRISDLFDEQDPIEAAYRLEVSSPGIDRPLTRLADYGDWASHEVRVKLVEPIEGRKILTGDIVGVGVGTEGDAVTIDVRGHHAMTVSFVQIQDAKLTITDRLLAATAPLSSAEADEVFYQAAPSDGADEFDDIDDNDASDETPIEELN